MRRLAPFIPLLLLRLLHLLLLLLPCSFYLLFPFLLFFFQLSSFAGFIFNRATHIRTPWHPTQPTLPRYSQCISVPFSPFLFLLPQFGIPSSRSVSFLFSSPSWRSVSSFFFFFFLFPFAATLVFVAPTGNGAACRGYASRTRSTYNGVRSSTFKGKGRFPPCVFSYSCPCGNPGIIGTDERRSNQLSN